MRTPIVKTSYASRDGKALVGCLVALGVVLVLLGIGVVVVLMNWRGWMASAINTGTEEMLKQADEFIRHSGGYEKLVIKVPIGWDELAVIRELRKRDIPVNCTCCMSYNQVIMAAAGANYASLFYGRIRDIGHDGLSIVRQIHATFRERQPACELIVGSIRHITDINDILQAGADIVTVPPKLFPQMVVHPKTDEVVNQFVTDFQKWMK